MFRARRRALIPVAGLLLASALAACGGSGSGGNGMDMSAHPAATATATSGTATVTIKGFAFNPSTLVINKGMTVKFVQEDSIGHNVEGATQGSVIHSPPVLNQGQSYSVTFSKPGTYDYLCTIHPNMRGTVIVRS